MHVPTRARLSIPGAALRRARRTMAVACLSAACAAGCLSAAQARSRALTDADVLEVELDTLYECAGSSIEGLGLSVARSDSASRVLQSDWVADARERWRVTVLVRVHERFGPGADAFVTRQRRQGDHAEDGALPAQDEPVASNESAPWSAAATTGDDQLTARTVTAGIAACWSERSQLAH